jgi:hypothetical protein
MPSGDKHGCWKGEDATYFSKHIYAKRHIKKPKRCPICNKIKGLDLCNIDHNYSRNLEDWFYACRGCHMKHDREKGLRISASEGAKKQAAKPGAKEKMSETMKKVMLDPKIRAKRATMTGKHHKKATIAKMKKSQQIRRIREKQVV